MDHLEKFINLFFWILSFVFFTISALIFYTIEYSGNGKRIGPIKEILDKQISLSVLFIIMLILLLLIISFGITKYILTTARSEVAKQVEINLNSMKSNITSDRNTIARIEGLLPVDYMIHFFEKKDFEIQTFSIDDVDLMDDFIESCNNPNLKFIDEDLEKLRILMINKMREMSNLLRNNNEQLGVSDFWRIPRNSKNNIYQLANKYSSEVWKLYEELLSSGRKKLGDREV